MAYNPQTNMSKLCRGFKLPASHVIHTVGPIYDVHSNPAALLRSSYKNSLSVAKEKNIQYIAFPVISCGVHPSYHASLRGQFSSSQGNLKSIPVILAILQQSRKSQINSRDLSNSLAIKESQ
ncbi:hypothetical protein Q3G72_018443 [Acer saccharum]|nr:hypothetical protein Q3G72_018443 [Acer saccharum]